MNTMERNISLQIWQKYQRARALVKSCNKQRSSSAMQEFKGDDVTEEKTTRFEDNHTQFLILN